MSEIHLWGVNQNNLKNIELKIPLGSLTVVCGPSGSGKSSLAFETLYAEGQRRYIESLSNYTKQFLNKAPKPDIEGIENIPPAISIEQKNGVKSSRSTVGTTTEITDYLRLLFAKIGHAYCPDHNITLEKDSPVSAAHKIIKAFNHQRGYVLTPILAEGRSYQGKKLHQILLAEGYMRIYVPQRKRKSSTKKIKPNKKTESKNQQNFSQVAVADVLELNDPALIKKGLPKNDFYLVIDRMNFHQKESSRIIDSLAQAYRASMKYNKTLMASQAEVITTEGQRMLISEDNSCSVCGYSFPHISPNFFSFNSPVGACDTCNGFGNLLMIDKAKVIPNTLLSIAEGAVKPLTMPSATHDFKALKKFCKVKKIDIHKPWEKLSDRHQKLIWNGNKDYYGIIGLFEYLETKKYKMHVRIFLARYKNAFTCPECKGSRLKQEALQVFVHNKSIADIATMSLDDAQAWLSRLKLSSSDKKVSLEVLKQLISRLGFLVDVGVGYLTLDRPTKTLSGGEYQRLNLSNQLGMGLSQTLYVLDEPTIGLHPRDNDRLIGVLKQLKELGNTLVIVEHDHDVINCSSHVIEMGPGSGHLGGQVLFFGDKQNFYNFPKSNTTPYLKPTKKWTPLKEPRPIEKNALIYKIELKGCKGNNLKNVNLTIPLNRLITVTGVSGSGKSSLISQTLYPALARQLNSDFLPHLEHKSLKGAEYINNISFLDQTPIGKTARSSPVTYLKIYDEVRKIFASQAEAKLIGYTPGTFSLNVDGGRCPVCKGLGFEVIDMMFMDDIHILCDTCDGKKFRDEVLNIKFSDKNIFEVLSLTVQEAMDFFVSYPSIRRPLALLKEVGLEYIQLGQSASTLSGGESQRLKVARELSRSSQKGTLYILDEPTTGLHFREVHLLLKVLNRLIDQGGSVLLIEHNLEVIKESDYIIDMGPEAGDKGGQIIAVGSPKQIIENEESLTGKYLKEYVND